MQNSKSSVCKTNRRKITEPFKRTVAPTGLHMYVHIKLKDQLVIKMNSKYNEIILIFTIIDLFTQICY